MAPSSSRRWREALVIGAVALAVRAAVLLLTPHALRADPDGYRTVGQNLLEHGVLGHGPYPTAVRPPLYPLILAGCALAGPADRYVLALVHLAMGVATVWLAWDLAQNCGLHRWQQGLVALLVACDPLLLRASTLVMTETLAALLATAALNLWTRYLQHPSDGRAALLGTLMGMGVLCRPHWFVWLVATGALLLICPTGGTPSNYLPAEMARRPFAKWWSVGLYTTAAALLLLPWAGRNLLQLGWPVLTTTHGGYTMFLANNPWLYEHLGQGRTLADWNPEPFHLAWHQAVEERFLLNPPIGLSENPPPEHHLHKNQLPPKARVPFRRVDEIRADRWAYQEAIKTIRENPGSFCRAVLLRWARLWQVIPSRAGDNPLDQVVYYGCLGWYGGEFILAIWGIWIIYTKYNDNPVLRNTLLLGLLWAVLLTGLHALYWTEMRMRAPLTAALALVVASGPFPRGAQNPSGLLRQADSLPGPIPH